MKRSDLFFKDNVLKCLMQDGEVSGLSFDMLVLLLQDTCSYNKKGGLLFLFEDSQTSELVNNNISFFAGLDILQIGVSTQFTWHYEE